MTEIPNDNLGTPEELLGRLDALRTKALAEQVVRLQDSYFCTELFIVSSIPGEQTDAARTLSHLRASLFSKEIGGANLYQVDENIIAVHVGRMTAEEYKAYKDDLEAMREKAKKIELSVEDDELIKIKKLVDGIVMQRHIGLNFTADLGIIPTDIVKSSEEMMKELEDTASNLESSGDLIGLVMLDPLRGKAFTDLLTGRIIEKLKLEANREEH